MGIAYGDQDSRDSMRAAVMPIWVGGEFIPAKVRLIRGDAEILLGMEVDGELRVTVDFNSRYFQDGQGEWQEAVRNGGNL